MKKLFLWSAVAAFVVLAAGCSKENTDGNGPGQQNGEKNVARLTIKTAELPQMRAADDNGEAPITGEYEIDTNVKLKVYVFQQGATGAFVSYHSLQLTGNNTDADPQFESYTSDPFLVAQGAMQFFVFANDSYDKITTETAGMTAEAFRQQPVVVNYSPDGSMEIVNSGSFLMGTLWDGAKATVLSTGTMESPQNISVTIGRLASKVTLAAEAGKDALANTNLPGAFSGSVYRLGTLAKKMNTVGIYEGTLLPYDPNDGVMVTSYLHDVAAPADDTEFAASEDYYQYFNTDFLNLPVYALENTTARSDDTESAQYYGNTTYLQIKTVFTPNDVFAPSDTEFANAIHPTGAIDFWTATVGGVMRFFNTEPSGAQFSDIVSYPGGVMYYKFPVFDPGEGDIVLRNRVLRNTSYTFNVNIVNELGTPDPVVVPTEPIAEQTAVEVTVTVLNWDKVEGSVDL